MFARKKELISALNTESGKLILKHLYEEFIQTSSLSDSATTLAYNLGKKELVQELINESRITEGELDAIQTTHEEYMND